MKPTMSRDGEPRVTVRVEYRLAREEFIAALAGGLFRTYDEPSVVGQGTAQHLVRDHLREGGGSWWAWDEEVEPDVVEACLDAARRSVDGFWA